MGWLSGNSAYTAQVAAVQSTRAGVAFVAAQAVAARAAAARAVAHGIAQHLSKAVVADKRCRRSVQESVQEQIY